MYLKEIQVTVMLNSIPFKNKPTADEVKKICYDFETRTISINYLRNALCFGNSIRPAIYDEKLDTFLGQQAFLIDVDNSNTFHSVIDNLNLCKELGIYPSIIYKTFSGNHENQKHRIVFIIDEMITDINERNKIQAKLNILFGGDTHTNDPKRIFFGGDLCYFFNPFSTIKADKINNL